MWVTNKEKFLKFIKEKYFPRYNIQYLSTWYWLKVIIIIFNDSKNIFRQNNYINFYCCLYLIIDYYKRRDGYSN